MSKVDETPEAGMEVTSSEKVFRTPELVDTICSFLDLKSLLTMRTMDHNWRELSYLSLKRRLRANIRKNSFLLQDPTNDEFLSFSARPLEQYKYQLTLDETSKRPLSSYSQLKLVINGTCLVQDVHPLLLPFPALLVASVLRMDWLSSVSQLRLYDCLTVVEWNVAGIGIVKLFPFLKVLEVVIRKMLCVYDPYGDVVPLCYAELGAANSEKKQNSSFCTLEHMTLTLHQDLLTADFPVTNISYDLISQCPELTRFNANVSWGSLKTGVARPSFSYTMNVTWNARGNPCMERVKCSVFPVIPSLDYNSDENSKAQKEAVLQDIINAINVIKPTTLTMPNNIEAISAVDPAVRLNIRHLHLENQPVAKFIPTGNALKAFMKFQCFKNLQRLSWYCKEGISDTLIVESDLLPAYGALDNLNTLTLIRAKPDPVLQAAIENSQIPVILLDTWLLKNMCKVAPKVKRLITNFADTNKDRLRVLELVASFRRLEHSILLDERWFWDSEDYNLEWTPAELACLHGITTLTVVVKNWKPQQSLNYKQALIRICDVVRTITHVGLLVKKHCGPELIDLREQFESKNRKCSTFISGAFNERQMSEPQAQQWAELIGIDADQLRWITSSWCF